MNLYLISISYQDSLKVNEKADTYLIHFDNCKKCKELLKIRLTVFFYLFGRTMLLSKF